MRSNKHLALIALLTILIYAVIFAIIVVSLTGTEVGWEADFSDVSNWNSGGVDFFTTDGDIATITSSSKHCHVVTSDFSSNLDQYQRATIVSKSFDTSQNTTFDLRGKTRKETADASGGKKEHWMT